MTVRELIKRSLTKLGVLAEGETPSASQLADGLVDLNALLGSWSNENLLINSRVKEVFPLVSAKQVYTMGPLGDFDTVRPMKVESAAAVDVQGIEIPIEILNLEQWTDIMLKNTGSTFPTRLFAEDTMPLMTLNFWPIPTEAYSVAITSWKPLTAFANANAQVVFPPGWERALITNLAIELAPDYSKSISAELGTAAVKSLANIKRMNNRGHLMRVDSALTIPTTFNYLTGQ